MNTLEPIELASPSSKLSGIDDRTTVPRNNTYEAVLESRDKKILDAVEKRLREAEKHKKFKDTKERKRGTQKEIRAYAIISSQLLDEIEDDPIMARRLVVKQRVWPEGIDWKQEKANGVTSGATYLKTKLYRTLAKQPFDSADARKVYVDFIEIFKATLPDCKTIDEVRALLKGFGKEEIYKSFVGDLTTETVQKISRKSIYFFTDKRKAEKKLEGVWGKSFHGYIFSASDAVYNTYKEAILHDAFSKELEAAYIQKRIDGIDKQIATITADASQFADFTNQQYIDRYLKTWNVFDKNIKADTVEPELMQTIISRVNGTYRLPQLNELKEEIKKGNKIPPEYQARKESWDWTKEPEKKAEANTTDKLIINARPRLDHISRIGGIKVPSFIGQKIGYEYEDDLGIHSIQFGNSLPDDERKQHAIFTYASFMDLEELLGVSIKGINQREKLGIDFATRGTAGSAATYWSDYKVINLNRKSGDGSLAHEWAHYLDNAFSGSKAGELKVNGREGRFATLGGTPDPELDALFKKWWSVASQSPHENNRVKVTFWADTKVKLHAQYYKDTLEESLKYLQTKRGYDEWRPKAVTTLAQVYGSIAHHFGLSKIDVELKSFYSDFYANSRAMDANKSKSYWASPVEMFARSFEEYVLSKMEEKGLKNTYLQSPNQWAKDYGVYPQGKEKERINEVFDELFAQIRKNFRSRMDFTGPRQTTEQVHEAVGSEVSDKKVTEKNKPSALEQELELEAIALQLQLELLDFNAPLRMMAGISPSQTEMPANALDDSSPQKKVMSIITWFLQNRKHYTVSDEWDNHTELLIENTLDYDKAKSELNEVKHGDLSPDGQTMRLMREYDFTHVDQDDLYDVVWSDLYDEDTEVEDVDVESVVDTIETYIFEMDDTHYEEIDSEAVDYQSENDMDSHRYQEAIEFKNKFIQEFKNQFKKYIHYDESAGFMGASYYATLLLDKNGNLVPTKKDTILYRVEQDYYTIDNVTHDGTVVKGHERIVRKPILKNTDLAVVQIRISDHNKKYESNVAASFSINISHQHSNISYSIRGLDHEEYNLQYDDEYSNSLDIMYWIDDLDYKDIIKNQDYE